MELRAVSKKYNQIIILQQLSAFQLLLKDNYLLMFVFVQASISYLTFILIVDNVATTPFAIKHLEMLSMFTIPTLIAFLRLNMHYLIYSPSIIYITQFMVISGVFGVLLSKRIKLSWYGSIERGMGYSFYIQQFILLYIFGYLLSLYGMLPVVILLGLQGALETFVILLQYIQDKHPNDPSYKYFNHLLQMGGRYVGTLSNPIHTAGYLVILLPVLLYIDILTSTPLGLVAFIGLYQFISIGVFLSQGRASTISYVLMTQGIIIISLLTNVPYKLPIIISLLIMLGLQYYISTKVNKQGVRFKELHLDITGELPIDEKNARIYTNNARRILWSSLISYLMKNKKYILKGLGISNIPKVYFDMKSKELNKYYNDNLVDSSHNYILDLIVSLGWIGQIMTIGVYLGLFITLIISGMYIPQLALIGFAIESMVAFPLQGNLLTIFLIQMLPMGLTVDHIIYAPYLTPILFAVQIFVTIINYQRYNNINLSMGHLSIQTLLANNQSKQQINELSISFQLQPYYDRGYTNLKYIVSGPLRQKLIFDDLTTFAIMLEDYEKTNIIENEPDFYYNIGNIYVQIQSGLIQAWKQQEQTTRQQIQPPAYLNTQVSKQKHYLFKSIRANPYSTLTLMLLHYYYAFIESNSKVATAIIDKVLTDIIDEYQDNITHKNIAQRYLTNFNLTADPRFEEFKTKILNRWPDIQETK